MSGIKEKLDRYLLPGFLLVSSLMLLVTGVPRFLHELMLVPGTPILYRVNAGEIVSEQDLETLEKSRLDALSIIELPDAYMDLGSSYLSRARQATIAEDRQKYAEMAIEASMNGLEIAPLNTFAWARLAAAHTLMGEAHHGDALEAWRTSIATSSFEPFLLAYRFHIGTTLYMEMTQEDIQLLKDQLAMAYRWQRGRIRGYGRQNNLVGWMTLMSAPDQEMAEFFSS